MGTNEELGEEIKHLYWQCYNCSSEGVRSPVLSPAATWCRTCSEDKLATAEATLMTLSISILDTWMKAHNEDAGNAPIKMISGRELRMTAWSPHNRANSGLLTMSWLDPRGQAAVTDWGTFAQLYEPASCFCSPIHTEAHFHLWNGEYLDTVTGEPIKDLEEEQISIRNTLCDYSQLTGKHVSENVDYYSYDLNISDNIQHPTMSSNSNNSLMDGAIGGEVVEPRMDTDNGGNADALEGNNNPYNGSKSLVSAKKGFTPFFKSIAVGKLLEHCPHPSLLSKALTVTESYEAATICRVIGLLQSGEEGVAELVKLSWIPQSIKGATLSELRARERFLLGKAAQSPGMDRWKQWSGVNDKPYVSKSEKKRQRGHQELCLLTLQDCDFFYKSAKRAVFLPRTTRVLLPIRRESLTLPVMGMCPSVRFRLA